MRLPEETCPICGGMLKDLLDEDNWPNYSQYACQECTSHTPDAKIGFGQNPEEARADYWDEMKSVLSDV